MRENSIRRYDFQTWNVDHPYTEKRSQMVRKAVPFEVVNIDEAEGRVEAIVSVMGIFDGLDIIRNGAYTKTISERFDKFRVLDQHSNRSVVDIVARPLAGIREIPRNELPLKTQQEYPDATGGLLTFNQFFMDDERSKAVFNRIVENQVEWSIGFDPVEFHMEKVTLADGETVTARILDVIRLWEWSAVIWGMNPATSTVEVSSASGGKRKMTTKAREDAPNYVAVQEGNPETCQRCTHFSEMDNEGGYCALYDFDALNDWRCDSHHPPAVVTAGQEGADERKTPRPKAKQPQPSAPQRKEFTADGPLSRFGDNIVGVGIMRLNEVVELALQKGEVDFDEYRVVQQAIQDGMRLVRSAIPDDIALRERRSNGFFDFFMFGADSEDVETRLRELPADARARLAAALEAAESETHETTPPTPGTGDSTDPPLDGGKAGPPARPPQASGNAPTLLAQIEANRAKLQEVFKEG